jgi:hypothetical protein
LGCKPLPYTGRGATLLFPSPGEPGPPAVSAGEDDASDLLFAVSYDSIVF